jgi:5'-phosphate synthase pdxT subunit
MKMPLNSSGQSRGVSLMKAEKEQQSLERNLLEPIGQPRKGEGRPRIGVLAIQGDYAAHAAALEEAGAVPSLVKTAEDLRLGGQSIDALILPGGESTTMLKFIERRGLFEPLREFCHAKPVFGTCAGAILLAREVRHPAQRSLGILDAVVERNAYGRQIDSSILEAETKLPGGPLEMVFIRAPRIVKIGPEVEALAFREGFPTLVRQGSVMAATFHPELSPNRRVHQLFVESVKDAMSKSR